MLSYIKLIIKNQNIKYMFNFFYYIPKFSIQN